MESGCGWDPHIRKSQFHFSFAFKYDLQGVDWFILRRSGDVGRSIGSGPSAKLPGYLRILPRKHLSTPCQFKWNPRSHSRLTSRSIHAILSTEICRLGQLSLVPELGHQPYLRAVGDVTAAMGTSVYESHPATVQPTQAGTDQGVLRRGHREASPSLGG